MAKSTFNIYACNYSTIKQSPVAVDGLKTLEEFN